MAEITEELFRMQQPATAPQAGVTEDWTSRYGATINFLSNRVEDIKRAVVQGVYNGPPTPNNLMDGVFTYRHAFKIKDAVLSSGFFNGTSGTFEFDVKWRPRNSGAWTSIFTTTPKFNAATVGQLTSIGVGQVATGMTAPVLFKTDFDAFDQLRFDLLQTPSGTVDSATLELFVGLRNG
jgi:hypothetical protein